MVKANDGDRDGGAREGGMGKGWWLHKDKQGYMASVRVSGSISCLTTDEMLLLELNLIILDAWIQGACESQYINELILLNYWKKILLAW